jgi:hypothetical protein
MIWEGGELMKGGKSAKTCCRPSTNTPESYLYGMILWRDLGPLVSDSFTGGMVDLFYKCWVLYLLCSEYCVRGSG